MSAELPSSKAMRYWGRIGGGFYDSKIEKGHTTPWGYVINLRRGGTYKARTGNTHNRPRHYTSILAENARARAPTKRMAA